MRTPYFPKTLSVLLASAWLAVASTTALAQAPVISSFGQNGQLVCTNLQPGSVASVEWAASASGPWTNNWTGLASVTVDSHGMMSVSVPMFYRVRGVGRGTNSSSSPTNMVVIPAGSFEMGDSLDGGFDALPVHTVQLSAYYMDRYEVTQALWAEVYQWATNHGYNFDNPGLGKAANHPVHHVNWYDAVKWCNARSEKEGLTPAYYTDAAQTTVYSAGQISIANEHVRWDAGYRLPTEAEWEKAARGGASERRFPWSDADTITHSRANYYSDFNFSYDVSPSRGFHPAFSDGGLPDTSPVGFFAPNGFGLYDMAGNVEEWCWDWFGGYSISAQTNPRGPNGGSYDRVIRGGNFHAPAALCRTAYRELLPMVPGSGSVDRIYGFRSVLPVARP